MSMTMTSGEAFLSKLRSDLVNGAITADEYTRTLEIKVVELWGKASIDTSTPTNTTTSSERRLPSVCDEAPRLQWREDRMTEIQLSQFHLPAVTVADTLGVFQDIQANPTKSTSAHIASRLNLPQRSVTILVRFLSSLRLVDCIASEAAKDEVDFPYRLTETSRKFLLPSSPYYYGGLLSKQHNPVTHDRLLDAVKNGANGGFLRLFKAGKDMTESGARVIVDFMDSPAAVAAEELFGPSSPPRSLFAGRHVLDVGCGSGRYSSELLRQIPSCKVTLFDLPSVVSQANARVCEVLGSSSRERVATASGNFFLESSWPKGHDMVFMSNVLHDWSLDDCKTLLANAASSLSVGGQICIHEMTFMDPKSRKNGGSRDEDDDRAGCVGTEVVAWDPLVAAQAVNMLVSMEGDQFTLSALHGLLKDAGFSQCSTHQAFGSYTATFGVKG